MDSSMDIDAPRTPSRNSAQVHPDSPSVTPRRQIGITHSPSAPPIADTDSESSADSNSGNGNSHNININTNDDDSETEHGFDTPILHPRQDGTPSSFLARGLDTLSFDSDGSPSQQPRRQHQQPTMTTAFGEIPRVDKRPRRPASPSDLSDMDYSDQQLGDQPTSSGASAHHGAGNTGNTTMKDVTITPPAAAEASPTPGPYAWYTPTFPHLIRPRKKIAAHIRREVAAIPVAELGAHVKSSLAAAERAFQLLMPDGIVRAATGKMALAPHLLTKVMGKAAGTIAEQYTAGAPSTALLGELVASNPGLDAELSAVADAVKSEHDFLISQLSKAVLKATNAETELVQTAFESREKSEELGLDLKKPFENRIKFLERMATATHLLVSDARDPELQADGEGRELEHALRGVHFLIQDALGDASVRRGTVEDAAEAAKKVARDLEDRWIAGYAATTSVQGKNVSGTGKSSKPKPKPKKDKGKGKGPASASGLASCLDTIASSPPPILPATNPANSDSAASGSGFGMQTGGASGSKTSPVRQEPARTFHSASSAATPPANSGARFLSNPPRESVRRPTANPTRPMPILDNSGCGFGFGFGTSPSSAGASTPSLSNAVFGTSGLGSAAAIPFGPGSTIPYSVGSTAPDFGFPGPRAGYVPPASIRNPLAAASGALGSGGREEREKGGDVVESPVDRSFRY